LSSCTADVRPPLRLVQPLVCSRFTLCNAEALATEPIPASGTTISASSEKTVSENRSVDLSSPRSVSRVCLHRSSLRPDMLPEMSSATAMSRDPRSSSDSGAGNAVRVAQ
jgi:hypothetical protein